MSQRKIKSELDILIQSILGKKEEKLSAQQIKTYRRKFLEGGMNALLALDNLAKNNAKAANYAKKLLQTANKSLANNTPTGSKELFITGIWQKANQILKENQKKIYKIPGVIGAGISFKKRNNNQTEEVAIIIYVNKKIEKQELVKNKKALLPQKLYSKTGASIITDVIEFGEFKHHIDAGSTIGATNPPSNLYGTIGAFANDITTGKSVAITAMHVTGLTDDFPPGDDIYFDAPYNYGSNSNPLGSLLRGTRNRVDAALINIDAPQSASNQIINMGKIKGWRPINLPGDFGTVVRLFGANSGYQVGIIKEPVINLSDPYLESAILVDIDTQPGDSGSAIVDNQNYILGILAGESTTLGAKVFSSIGLILKILSCEIN